MGVQPRVGDGRHRGVGAGFVGPVVHQEREAEEVVQQLAVDEGRVTLIAGATAGALVVGAVASGLSTHIAYVSAYRVLADVRVALSNAFGGCRWNACGGVRAARSAATSGREFPAVWLADSLKRCRTRLRQRGRVGRPAAVR